MSNHGSMMTHAARARRRAQVAQAVRKGVAQTEIAEKFGLSVCYVRHIAKTASIALPDNRGKRRAWRDCPPNLIPVYDALVRKKIMKAEKAKQFLMGVSQ